jgi:hypothetical protein
VKFLKTINRAGSLWFSSSKAYKHPIGNRFVHPIFEVALEIGRYEKNTKSSFGSY